MENTYEKLRITTKLGNEITELSDEETELLFEFRMSDAEQQAEIQNLIESVKQPATTNQ